MTEPAELGRVYDAAFAARAPAGLRVRPETGDDEAFLRALWLETFPLRDVLPAPLLAQQVELRIGAFRNNYLELMRRIAVGPDRPVGRIIIDWSQPAASHCVDVAVRAADGRRGVASALLGAWIEVAEGRGIACTLNVAPDNPARALYARLGFRATADDPAAVSIAMVRPVGG
jgi:ribosomal protein S18 acetylase RimI-like enzyme